MVAETVKNPRLLTANTPNNRGHNADAKRFSNKAAVRHAVELQDIALRDIHNPETKPSVRAALIRAWDILEERKRILRMRPKPRDLDTTTIDKSKRKRRTPSLSVDPEGKQSL